MKKLWQILLAIGAVILGIFAMSAGSGSKKQFKKDLKDNCIVIVEGLQTILRKHGYQNAYEIFKDLSRNNNKLTINDIRVFIKELDVKESIKKELYNVTVENYVGTSSKFSMTY